MVVQPGRPTAGLLPQRPPSRPDTTTGTGRCSGTASAAPPRRIAGAGASSTTTCALVPLIPNDDTPARADDPSSRAQGRASCSSASPLPLPVDVRRGLLGVQGPRQPLVLQRQHHLDHADHARSRLRVADVRLRRAQVQRPVAGVAPGPNTSASAPASIGSPSVVPVPCASIASMSAGGQAGRGQRVADHPLLRGPVGRGQPLAAAVLVDRRAADHRQHPVAVALRVATAA